MPKRSTKTIYRPTSKNRFTAEPVEAAHGVKGKHITYNIVVNPKRFGMVVTGQVAEPAFPLKTVPEDPWAEYAGTFGGPEWDEFRERLRHRRDVE